MAIIGIDLGTTNSLGSVYRNGSVELIPNAYNSFITPSVVAIKPDGQVLVGAPAKKYQLECPENAASLFKRKMGSKDRIKVGDKHLLPEELSSLVIGSIITDAERFLDEKVEEAVISVPAYFYDDQRYATKKAGTLAGVKVDRIVNEPSAAALANYYHEGKEKHLLIFDFGGGTLDVSVVDCLGNVIGIESIAGDNVLGGSDFDVLIADSFCKEHKLTDLSELEKEALITVSEQCKKRLTDSKETELVFVLGENKYTSHYTLKRLATESEDILKKIRSVVNHALQDAGLRIDEIEEIIMVGGSSKMPLVQSYMQFLFQKVPVVTSNCDEQVAIGVGAFCGIKTKSDGIKQYSLSDVCPFSLSVNNFNKHNPERPYSDVLIPRNSMLPCSHENEYSTVVDKQTKLKIGVYQGESMYADDNMELDTISVTVPARSAGEETVKVRFTYDVNGLLIVDVTKKDGEHIRKLISQKLSDEEIEKSIINMEKLIVHPKDTQENKDLLERLEKCIAESTGDLREYFMGMAFYFEELLDGQNVWRIAKVRDAMGKELDDYSKWRNNSLADNIEVSTFLNEYEKDLSADEAWGEDEAADDENSPDEWEEFKKWIN